MTAPTVRLATDLEPWDRHLDPAQARYLRDTLRLPQLREAAKQWKRGRKWASTRAAFVTTTGGTVLALCAYVGRTKIVLAGFAAELDGEACAGVGIDVAALTELHEYSIIVAPPALGAEAPDGVRPLILIDHGRAGQPRSDEGVARRFDVVIGLGEVRHNLEIGPHVLH